MVKAEDLIKQQKKRKELKNKTYLKVYERVEKKILLSSKSDFYECDYEVPSLLIGVPIYSVSECEKFLIKKLKKNGFKVKKNDDKNNINISWYPK